MIKCPLCGWNNAESTQHCVSCGGDLENRTGLIVEEGNPNCYSFTPPRRILNKGVGVAGSGNDLVFKFSSSGLAILLIIVKLILFGVFPYMMFVLYREGNSLFYILVPLSILFMIDILGWILLSFGGRKKKRKHISLGLRFLYAFHAIAVAYCILTLLIMIYLSIAIGLSWNLGNSINFMIEGTSSRRALSFMAVTMALLLLFIIFLNICAKFFYHTHDVFSRNSLKYYRFTGVIAVVFIITAVISVACVGLMIYKDSVLEFISRYEILETYLYSFVFNYSTAIAACSGLFALLSLISAFMVMGYIRSYKSMFVSE